MNLLPALALATLISDDACSARLDRLLVLYRDYGLPLPPPDAPLLRNTWGGTPPSAYLSIDVWPRPDRAELEKLGWYATIVKPDPVALGKDVSYGRLDFAIACHERGWRALARAAFRKWIATTQYQRAERQLAFDAWHYWHDQLTRGAPLEVAATYMKRALPHAGFAGDEAKVALLRSLDLAMVPARSAPDSDDALIDALIYDPHSWAGHSHAYRALARRGFDALPALIAHLGDDRLTRALVGGGLAVCDGACLMSVKDIVYQLICTFAGKQLEPSKDVAARTQAVGRWFADAQKMGEEKYLVAHFRQGVIPGSRDVLFPLLVEKYPHRLPEVYRRFLDTKDRSDLDNPYAKAIVEAPIPLADKLKVLEYAATHPAPGHRWVGLHYLREVDPKRGNELLIAALDRLETTSARDEIRLAQIVPSDIEAKVWAALARAAKRTRADTRVLLLEDLAAAKPTAPTCRRLQLALLADHLTDAEVAKTPDHQTAVGNHAAALLATMFDFGVQTARNRTPAQWAHLHERVRHALEHALRR